MDTVVRQVLRSGATVAAVLAAAGVRSALQPILGNQEPFVTFYLAVVLVAWFGNWMQGLLAVVLGAWLAAYLFVGPEHHLAIERSSDAIALALYVLIGLFITGVCAALRRASRRAILSAAQADMQRRATEAEEHRRVHAEAVATSAHEDLFRQQQHEHLRVQADLERCRAELERQARLAAIGQVSARIAHDMRNTLGVVMNGMFLLRNNLRRGVPPEAQVIEMIETEARASKETIGNLLASSRPAVPRSVAVDLADVARAVIHSPALERRAELTLHLEREPFEIWVDPMQFEQVLRNLAQNSLEAARGPLEIRISASSNGEQDVITFADNGPGISAELKSRLFEPFVSTKEKGAGLGLAVCRQIIERHGGQIRAVPDVERGAAIRITLPVRPLATAANAPATPANAPATPTGALQNAQTD